MLEAIKLAAMDAFDVTSMADVCIGTVTSSSPLKVRLEQNLELGERFLILARNVTDYEIHLRLRLDGQQPHTGMADIYNALTAGEKVVLCKAAGGQKYIIIDRVGN